MNKPTYSELVKFWGLDKNITFLNHGSFGACPLPVLEKQNEYRKQMEAEPLRFFLNECDELLEKSRTKCAEFINCKPRDLVFVTNATSGVNTVLKSIKFNFGDEILFTNHIYPACRNTIYEIAEENGLNTKEIKLFFPFKNSDDIADKILSSVTDKTKLVLIDHISSLPGIVFPVEKIVCELNIKGIDTLVDGAHAPGMIPLDIEKINAAYYTGNCHKWLCTPKGSAILHIREDKQPEIKPLVRSRRFGECETKLSKLQYNFSWNGTDDPTSFICIPDALDFMGNLFPGGWSELMARNHNLASEAGKKICEAFEIEYPYTDEMTGTLFGIPFFYDDSTPETNIHTRSKLQAELFENYNIEVVVSYWPEAPQRLLRIAAQAYNDISQYEYLIDALKEIMRGK